MNLKDVQALLSNEGESSTVEFKKSTGQLRTAAETLCAFLNGTGGTLLFGITDAKKIVGQEVTDKTKRNLSVIIGQIAPAPKIQCHYIEIQPSLYIIVVEAFSLPAHQPYTFNGKAYYRIESSTHVMSRDHYHHVVFQNLKRAPLRWEDGVLEDINMSDLDGDEILKTLHIGIENNRIPEDAVTTDPEKALKQFDLLNSGKITNAAVVLYAHHPERWFPQCVLKLAQFRGKDRLGDFIDNRQVSGNIFHLMTSALEYAQRALPIASHFKEGEIERVDAPLFPRQVLREVFCNALSHRDYSLPGGCMSFAVYVNRLEVWNCGAFPPGIHGNDIKVLHKSLPPNPKIAKILYYRKMIETWGRGISLIVRSCLTAGHPEPTFSKDTVGVTVTLPSNQLIGPEYSESSSKILEERLSLRQQEILSLINSHKEITLREIKEQLVNSPAERTLQDDLARLKSLGFIVGKGRGRGAVWMVYEQVLE